MPTTTPLRSAPVRALLRSRPAGWSWAGLIGIALVCATTAVGLGRPPQ